MMKRFEPRALWGIILIAAGTLFLLDSLEITRGIGALSWALLFGASGLAAMLQFARSRTNVWLLIPGFALVSIAAVIALSVLAPAADDIWGGPLILGAIGLSFWLIYLSKREYWWAIIPGGALATLAVVAGLSPILEESVVGGVFFVGLGLTFGLVRLLPSPQERMKWPLILGAVLLALGLVIVAASTSSLGVIFPAALVAAGIYVIVRKPGSEPA
jgi:hypothetical protein